MTTTRDSTTATVTVAGYAGHGQRTVDLADSFMERVEVKVQLPDGTTVLLEIHQREFAPPYQEPHVALAIRPPAQRSGFRHDGAWVVGGDPKKLYETTVQQVLDGEPNPLRPNLAYGAGEI
jgi:hypothetical protein